MILHPFLIPLSGSPNWADILSAAAATVSAAVLIAAALYARAQVREARTLRESQTRPYVVVDFDVFTNSIVILLQIANVGTTVARNVRFAFNPPLATTLDTAEFSLAQLGVLARGLPMLQPGRSISLLFDSSLQRFDPKRTHGLPDVFDVTVTYEGPTGNPYTDNQRLDLTIFEQMSMIEQRTVHDVANALREINRELAKWTEGTRGLLVKTPADVTREVRASIEENERRTAEALAKQKAAKKPAKKKTPRPKQSRERSRPKKRGE